MTQNEIQNSKMKFKIQTFPLLIEHLEYILMFSKFLINLSTIYFFLLLLYYANSIH